MILNFTFGLMLMLEVDVCMNLDSVHGDMELR